MDEETKNNIEKIHQVAQPLDDAPELEELYDETVPEVDPEQERLLFIQSSITHATPPHDKGLSLEAIDAAYKFLEDANNEMWTEQLNHVDRADDLKKLKWLLELEKNKAMAEGKIDGKNEDARKAQVRELFKDLIVQIENLEREIALDEVDNIGVCKLRLTNAHDNIDRINTKLRFLELAQLAGAMESAQQQVPVTKPQILTAKKGVH